MSSFFLCSVADLDTVYVNNSYSSLLSRYTKNKNKYIFLFFIFYLIKSMWGIFLGLTTGPSAPFWLFSSRWHLPMLTAHPQAALSPVRVRNLVPECLNYSAFTDTCQCWLHFHRLHVHYFSAPKFFYCCEKNPFTYSKYVDYPRSCLPSILCGGKNLNFFFPSLTYLWLSACTVCTVHLIL